MSSVDGGSFVNSGTYGCVFNPPIKCFRKKNVSAMTNAAGKIFDDDKSFKDEYNELKKIHKLDPKYKFTVPYIGHCKVHTKDFQPSDEADKCTRHISQTKNKYTQLIYKFGGIDLNKYYKYPTRYFIHFEDFVRLFLPVMEGIRRLGDKKIAHVDIKPENLLLDLSVPKIYLIDFGLITPFNMLKDETYFHDHEYPYYPPEFKVLSLLKSGNYTVDEAMDVFMKNFNFYNQAVFMKWVTSKWSTYTKTLRDFFESFVKSSLKDVQTLFEKAYVQKLDSYGLAMTLIEIIYRLSSTKQLVLKNPSKDFTKHLLQQVLFPMIHPDPIKRMDINNAIPILEGLLTQYVTTPVPSPTQVPPVPPAPAAPAAPVPGSPPKKAPVIPVESPPSPTKPPLSLTECLNLKIKQIQELLKKFKLPTYGNKAALCKRLMDYLKTQPPYAPVPAVPAKP